MTTQPAPVPLLAISGPVGVGKSTVLAGVHDILTERMVPHACVDRDALSYSWPQQGRFNEITVLRNLADVWANFRAAGAERLVVAGVVEDTRALESYCDAVPGARVIVGRLSASVATRAARLRAREVGAGLEWHLRRTVELDAILDAAPLENFTVDNDARPIRDVATEVLSRAGWLSSPV